MVKVRQDLTGQKFGRLTVLEQVEDYVASSGQHRARWKCVCDCGNIIEVNGKDLKNGKTKSCGCYNREQISLRFKKYNTYDLTGEYGIGYTSNGEEFYFDLEDYDKIKDYCWWKRTDGYFQANMKNKRSSIRLSRLIMDCPKYMYVDHIDHNLANNKKSNLRICTNSQNSMNRGLQSNNITGYTGVNFSKLHSKWRAYIKLNNKQIHLGLYQNIEDAIQARKEAEEKYFGEYAYKGD